MMPDRAGGDRIRVGSFVRHRDFSFQRGHVVGLFISDGLAWAEVRWDGFDRPHLVDPEVIRRADRLPAVIILRGLSAESPLPDTYIETNFAAPSAAHELPKESAEARGGGAKGESIDDRSEGEAAEGAPVVKTATDQATGQVQAGAVDPNSASAPKPSTISSAVEAPGGFAVADSVPLDDGSGQRQVEIAVGSPLPIEREARALIEDIDAWVATGLPVTQTHLASASERLKMAMQGHTTRWTSIAERDTTNYAALYNAVVRDLSAIAKAVGNTNGGADITLGLVRELVATKKRWARLFKEPIDVSKLAGEWVSLVLTPGITRHHAARELDDLLDRVRREEREACIEIADRYCGMSHGASCPTEIRAWREAADKTSKGGTSMRATGESPERGAEEHARPDEPKTDHRDGLPGSDSASAGEAVAPPSATDLRRVAALLEERANAPSKLGYRLVEGLLAAADLLEGKAGPLVDRTGDFGQVSLADFARVRLPGASRR